MSRPKVFRYSLNQKLRRAVHWIMSLGTMGAKEERLDLHKEQIKNILIVRATFRMGDSILAIPAILSFRNRFPQARIDFVGAPISAGLFQNLPIDNHFTITRRYPGSAMDYPRLLQRLRSVGYDLAVDVSCSQSAMGSFLVGFSRARYRVGLKGKWDRWFNVRVARPPETNKYKILPDFLRSLGLKAEESLPSLALSTADKEQGGRKIQALGGTISGRHTVGVFVGGRKAWRKRWPVRHFCELITALHCQGVNVVTFVGPEEEDSIGYLRDALDSHIPIVFEPSPRDFAAMVFNCDLFVTCDSGPMHMACGLGIPTVAIFQNPNFDRWAPPSSIARIVYQPGGCSAEEVLRICREELAVDPVTVRDSGERVPGFPPLVSIPAVSEAVERLEKSVALQRLLFFSRWAQGFFVLLLLIYAWLFPSSSLFAEGTSVEQLADAVGTGTLIIGGLLHMWAVSHGEPDDRLHQLTAPQLITTGPYAYIRHPRYVANFLIGAGMVFLLDAIPLAIFLLGFFALYHGTIVPAEEEFLKQRFGDAFIAYYDAVPKYVPVAVPRRGVSFGSHLPVRELCTIWAIILAASFLEWLESPVHRGWIVSFYHWVNP